ncbi:MAG: type I-E CRISPR-associated protein Cse1/CasA [Caldicoprobacterales bacterium]
MHDKEFNLLYEPWIKVMKKDGDTTEVSVLDLFRHAHEFQSLAGELPTQNVAILRLLLAILHAVFERYDVKGNYSPFTSPDEALTRWQALWEKDCFPMDIIEEYLLHFEDRFYLFHPEHPFYQVPELKKAGFYSAGKLNGLLSESDNKIRLFPLRAGDSKSVLTYSEAARWLVYVNAFDDVSGSGKGRGETKRAKYELAWLAKLGLITAEGNDLFETLLLNLIFLKDGSNELWGNAKPIWEQDVRTKESCSIPIPDNLAELYTVQSRRLILQKQNNMVMGYGLIGGDFFPEENAFVEQMTVWANRAKKTDAAKYLPRLHDSSRQLWRDFSALVSQSETSHRPGIVSWLTRLRRAGLLSNYIYRFQTAAVKFDSKKMSINDVFSDSLSFSADLLSNLGDPWIERIIDEIAVTEKLVEQVGRLAQNLAQAAGAAEKEGFYQRDLAREQAYFRLDMPFRRWLQNINPEQDSMNDTCNKWWEQEKKIIRSLGRELVNQAGPQAFVGRVKENEKTNRKYRYSAADAYNQFLYRTSSREALFKKGEGKNGKG